MQQTIINSINIISINDIIILLFFVLTIKAHKPQSQILLQYNKNYKDKTIYVIDIHSNKEKKIILPKYVRLKKFILLSISDKISGVEIEMYDAIPLKTKDNIRFSIYFSDTPYGAGNLGITCGIGTSPYNSPAPSRFGHLQGGVFSRYLPLPGKISRWIGQLTYAAITQNKIIFHFENKFILNKFVRFVVITYIPHRYVVYWKVPKRKLKGILADGIDFECPDVEEVIYMTIINCVPEP